MHVKLKSAEMKKKLRTLIPKAIIMEMYKGEWFAWATDSVAL